MIRIIKVLVFTLILSTLTSASPANAAGCRESVFGSSFGKQFNCPDGTRLTIKPNFGTYNDPFTSYRGSDNYGNSYRCKYNEFRRSYSCK